MDISGPENNIPEETSKNALEKLHNANATTATKVPYQRTSNLSTRQQSRHRVEQQNLAHAAETYSQPLGRFFSSTSVAPESIPFESKEKLRQEAIKDLEKKLDSKRTILNGQNLTRDRAVLALLRTTEARRESETREDLSFCVSRAFGKGVYFARKLVEWEGTWIRSRSIPEGTRGCYAKTASWFNDEGVQTAVREWCAGVGERKFTKYFLLL